MGAIYRSSFCVAVDHPCLAGHFPGRPVVPGVFLLEHVVHAAETWTGLAPGALHLPQIKFRTPLLPGQYAEIELQRSAARLRFIVRHGDVVIANGEMEVLG